ncbi:GNAT family N-acetyltransferase [Salinimicrobium sp. TH3]|uniref:GNAT family N-acetyltransferase n=1 Tax=Salinimicrobium sp. TH3 TaxID=2997342 RepID=UPI002275A9A2|nr:GNAT family protein [Salinimicrobium sp. TH3]MCY2686957.1 GNAT family protein [Salinimicrobium sp. TH3]
MKKAELELKLRGVVEEDSFLLFKWANSSDVRKNAIDPQRIEWKKHQVWFREKNSSPYSKIYILENKNLPIGQVRYDRKEQGFWYIDFFIEQKFRGLGLGKKIIGLSRSTISGPVKALVKKENLASHIVFQKLGFVKTRSEKGIVEYLHK